MPSCSVVYKFYTTENGETDKSNSVFVLKIMEALAKTQHAQSGGGVTHRGFFVNRLDDKLLIVEGDIPDFAPREANLRSQSVETQADNIVTETKPEGNGSNTFSSTSPTLSPTTTSPLRRRSYCQLGYCDSLLPFALFHLGLEQIPCKNLPEDLQYYFTGNLLYKILTLGRENEL